MTLGAGANGCGGGETLVERDAAEGACVASDAWQGFVRALAAALEPDRRLVSSPPDAITRVEITAGTTRLALARASATSWRLEAPKESYLLDPRAVDDWLAALGRVDARPPGAAGKPQVRHLAVEARYRETADVAPGDPGYALLDPDPLRFRDRAVLDFAHFDARELRRTPPAGAPSSSPAPTARTGGRSRRPARPSTGRTRRASSAHSATCARRAS